MERLHASAAAGASAAMRNAHAEEARATGRYVVECYGEDGMLKWSDEVKNLVTNAGKIDQLDKYFGGSAYTAAFYFGLVDGASAPTFNAADTMASHAGWTESTAYSNATRPAASFAAATASGGGAGSAGTGTKATQGASAFNINASATIAGVFLTTNATKGGTTGTLYSAAAFTGGNRVLQNGDTLNVTYQASI